MSFNSTEVERLLVQTGRRCCVCTELHRVQVHHIVPVEKGGTDEIDNAIPLCPKCHDEAHTGYEPGRVTRCYTASELRKHREQAIERAKNPSVPSASNNKKINPEMIKTATELSKVITALNNDIYIYLLNNFEPYPNEELKHLRQRMSDFSDFIWNSGWMFDESIPRIAREIYECFWGALMEIVRGNSHRDYHNHNINLEGLAIRDDAFAEYNRRMPELRTRLEAALRAGL